MQPTPTQAPYPVRRIAFSAGVALALCVGALAIPASPPARAGDPLPVIVGAPFEGGLVFKLTITGSYQARPCAGRMRLTYRAERVRTVRRLTRLSSSCHYRRTIRLHVRRAARLPTTLRVHQRFLGNRSFPAGRAKTVSARLVPPRS